MKMRQIITYQKKLWNKRKRENLNLNKKDKSK